MDPCCVAPKKLRGGHISTATLRFFASGLSWIKTLAHDGDNDDGDGEKWRAPMMEDNLLYHLVMTKEKAMENITMLLIASGYDIHILPWKITTHAINIGKPSISMAMGHGLTMASPVNVITRG